VVPHQIPRQQREDSNRRRREKREERCRNSQQQAGRQPKSLQRKSENPSALRASLLSRLRHPRRPPLV